MSINALFDRKHEVHLQLADCGFVALAADNTIASPWLFRFESLGAIFFPWPVSLGVCLLNAGVYYSILFAAMSERQRFFVELLEEKGTMISWKGLVAGRERLSSASGAQEGLLTTDLPCEFAYVQKSNSNTKLVVSSSTDTALETSDSKPNRISPFDQDTDSSSCEHGQKPNGGSTMDSSVQEEAKIESDKEVGLCTLVHRATPTSCDSVDAGTRRFKE